MAPKKKRCLAKRAAPVDRAMLLKQGLLAVQDLIAVEASISDCLKCFNTTSSEKLPLRFLARALLPVLKENKAFAENLDDAIGELKLKPSACSGLNLRLKDVVWYSECSLVKQLGATCFKIQDLWKALDKVEENPTAMRTEFMWVDTFIKLVEPLLVLPPAEVSLTDDGVLRLIVELSVHGHFGMNRDTDASKYFQCVDWVDAFWAANKLVWEYLDPAYVVVEPVPRNLGAILARMPFASGGLAAAPVSGLVLPVAPPPPVLAPANGFVYCNNVREAQTLAIALRSHYLPPTRVVFFRADHGIVDTF